MKHNPIRAAVALLLLGLGAQVASGDSWVQPQPILAAAPGGGWYVVLTPQQGQRSKFVLVQRRAGAGPKSDSPQVEKGDRIAARGECHTPMGVWCLDDGEGFVIFETYGAIGHGHVLQRYDAEGRPLWHHDLKDFFKPGQIAGFRNSVGSTWWYEAAWIDGRTGHVVVAHESPKTVDANSPIRGPNLGAPRRPGVLRVRVSDGAHAVGREEDLMGGLEKAAAKDRAKVLKLIGRSQPKGWAASVRRLLADEKRDAALRVLAAVVLKRAGDARGQAFVERAARAKQPADARAIALEALPEFLGKAALPVLQEALKDGQQETGLALYRALRAFGAEIVSALTQMTEDLKAPTEYRVTAIQLLHELGAEAHTALPALAQAAAGKDARVAEFARDAVRAIKRARR